MRTARQKKTIQCQKDILLASLLPLTETCPVDECNSEDCPLHLVRKMKPRLQLEWFNALPEDDLEYLAAYHHICLKTKLPSQAKLENLK